MKTIFTLKELQETTEVFNDFRTIEDCDIPDYYKKVFPHKCACGGEMIMTEPGHTQLQCCNPNCWVKMGYRLSYFISKLGYKGFGDQSALALVSACKDEFEYSTFLSAFLLSNTQLLQGLSDHYAGMFADIRDDIHERGFHLVEAISALGIPNVGSRSPLFNVVKAPLVFLKAVLMDKTDDMCDVCGIRAPSTRYYLKQFQGDILILFKEVMPHIVETPKGEIYVAITGKVTVDGHSYSRGEFVALCESIRDTNGIQLYKIVETKAASKLEFVIADEPSNSEKYQLGLRLNKLITADEFYQHLLTAIIPEKSTGEEENDV